MDVQEIPTGMNSGLAWATLLNYLPSRGGLSHNAYDTPPVCVASRSFQYKPSSLSGKQDLIQRSPPTFSFCLSEPNTLLKICYKDTGYTCVSTPTSVPAALHHHHHPTGMYQCICIKPTRHHHEPSTCPRPPREREREERETDRDRETERQRNRETDRERECVCVCVH